MSERQSESIAEMLDADAEAWVGEGQHIIRQIEEAETKLVRLREHRDRLFRMAAEARTAANVLRDVGLRSSLMDGKPHVAVDYVPQPPLATSSEPASGQAET